MTTKSKSDKEVFKIYALISFFVVFLLQLFYYLGEIVGKLIYNITH